MDSYPAPALAMVEKMHAAAAADPARAIAFQGAPGANSHRAVNEWDPAALPLPCYSFAEAIEAVEDGRAGCAMIPIDNSQAGRVADIHFLLPESSLSIVGEHFLSIHHALMAIGDSGPFKGAFSHPHALSQSRHYLRTRNIVPLAHADTAGAAAHVAELGDPEFAAIAPKLAADLYGLKIVDERVEDAEDNTTRFVVLAKQPLETASLRGQETMTTFVFEVKNSPASLYKAMGGFATNGVNMTKLESYQKGASFAITMFYADIIGSPDDPAVGRALEELAFHCNRVRMFGTYPLARQRG
ncbi:prephenate dehydratase [Aurantiacibacter rhizosphaerae]|uniref:prephenate dehydratase n=1 Tax=Aurantiacibacter rhizosphaerae TaxID=2691582 RepID=A0A844XBD2_9SPHN|nr:prephenate dehydratase [Aurantiacibacter rhizosphaerae]MWV27089.1 prephenate dehydratase [Aurantiacibacter rhizosphaerae]